MVDTGLGANVGVVVTHQNGRGRRGNLDDRGGVRHHTHQRLHPLIRPLELQVHHHVQLFLGGLLELSEQAKARGVHCNIDLAVGIHDGPDGRLDVFHLGDVTGHSHAADLSRKPFELFGMPASHSDGGALFSKTLCNDLAHVAAPGCTQHVCHFACQSSHDLSPFIV